MIVLGLECGCTGSRRGWSSQDQAVPRKSEGLPDRTAAAVQPLKEEKARLFAVVEGCSWALLKDPWLWDTGLNVSTVVLEL